MLTGILEKAVSIGASSVEIEYGYGKAEITAFSGNIGVGVACLDSKKGGKPDIP